MKKLALDLDALAVQSFETGTDAGAARGTVNAHEPTRGAGHTCVTCAETCATCPVTPTNQATCYC